MPLTDEQRASLLAEITSDPRYLAVCAEVSAKSAVKDGSANVFNMLRRLVPSGPDVVKVAPMAPRALIEMYPEVLDAESAWRGAAQADAADETRLLYWDDLDEIDPRSEVVKASLVCLERHGLSSGTRAAIEASCVSHEPAPLVPLCTLLGFPAVTVADVKAALAAAKGA